MRRRPLCFRFKKLLLPRRNHHCLALPSPSPGPTTSPSTGEHLRMGPYHVLKWMRWCLTTCKHGCTGERTRLSVGSYHGCHGERAHLSVGSYHARAWMHWFERVHLSVRTICGHGCTAERCLVLPFAGLEAMVSGHT